MSEPHNFNHQGPSPCSPDVPQQVHQSKSYLTTREAATFIGFAPITLVIWRQTDKGPPFIRVGRMIRYRRSDLDDFMTSQLAGNVESKLIAPLTRRALPDPTISAMDDFLR